MICFLVLPAICVDDINEIPNLGVSRKDATGDAIGPDTFASGLVEFTLSKPVRLTQLEVNTEDGSSAPDVTVFIHGAGERSDIEPPNPLSSGQRVNIPASPAANAADMVNVWSPSAVVVKLYGCVEEGEHFNLM